MLFVLGLSTSFVILGFGAGLLGSVINGRMFSIVTGFIVILFGIHQMGLFHLKILDQYKGVNFKRTQKGDFFGTYLLGVTFSFAWTPCVGPVLGAVLVLSAGAGQAFYGAWMMLIYTLGLAIPFLLMATLSKFLLERLHVIEKHLNKIKVVGGVLIVIMGLLLMTEKLTIVTIWFEKLL